MTMAKPPVLVILPPTHKCPDLERILALARSAFDNAALNLLDLNLRFDWVSFDSISSPGPAAALGPDAGLLPQGSVPALAPTSPSGAAHSVLTIPSHKGMVSPAITPITLPEASPNAPYRILVGNILHDVPGSQLLTVLFPPGMMPIGMTFRPAQNLVGRPERCRYVLFELCSQNDLERAHKWMLAQAAPGGRAAELVPPNVKFTILKHKTKSPPSTIAKPQLNQAPVAPAVPSSNSAVVSPQCPAVTPTPAPAAGPVTDMPEASPNHYRLHVSNLKPDLELAPIVAALVPRDVKLAGASLFSPRPMGGSKRDLVRSLKFAFFSAADAKRCQEWIKKDGGGGVSKVVFAGAKIAVGNPMDPMVSDPMPVDAGQGDHPPPPSPQARIVSPPMHGPPVSGATQVLHSPASPHSPAPTSPIVPRPLASASPIAPPLVGLVPPQPAPSPSPPASSLPSHPKQFHISLVGIDPAKPVATVFGAILGSLSGPIEPARMGVRNAADGRRGVEFVFDSEDMAKQFVLQVWMRIRDGQLASVTAEGEKLVLARGKTEGT